MPISMLSGPDRDFFRELTDIVFGNPFSTQRSALIVRLAPGAPANDLVADREALARVVTPRLAPYLHAGTTLGADDRRLIEPAQLYVGYHRCVPQLDALIERQASEAGAPLPVPFA